MSLEFFIDISCWPNYGREVDAASNRIEYQEYFLGVKGGRCLGLTTLPPSCADYLETLESSGPVLARTGISLPSLITSKTEMPAVIQQ